MSVPPTTEPVRPAGHLPSNGRRGAIGGNLATIALVVGFVLGALAIIGRVQLPSGFALLVSFYWIAPLLLIGGEVLDRHGKSWARWAAVVGGLWTGFLVGFVVIGVWTCAFCLA